MRELKALSEARLRQLRIAVKAADASRAHIGVLNGGPTIFLRCLWKGNPLFSAIFHIKRDCHTWMPHIAAMAEMNMNICIVIVASMFWLNASCTMVRAEF